MEGLTRLRALCMAAGLTLMPVDAGAEPIKAATEAKVKECLQVPNNIFLGQATYLKSLAPLYMKVIGIIRHQKGYQPFEFKYNNITYKVKYSGGETPYLEFQVGDKRYIFEQYSFFSMDLFPDGLNAGDSKKIQAYEEQMLKVYKDLLAALQTEFQFCK